VIFSPAQRFDQSVCDLPGRNMCAFTSAPSTTAFNRDAYGVPLYYGTFIGDEVSRLVGVLLHQALPINGTA
jgi:hypothetical protein